MALFQKPDFRSAPKLTLFVPPGPVRIQAGPFRMPADTPMDMPWGRSGFSTPGSRVLMSCCLSHSEGDAFALSPGPALVLALGVAFGLTPGVGLGVALVVSFAATVSVLAGARPPGMTTAAPTATTPTPAPTAPHR